MRIPVLEEQPSAESRPLPTPYRQDDLRTGLEGVAQGFEQANKVVGQAAAAYREAKAKADMVAVNDQLTDYLHDNNTLKHGQENPLPAAVASPDQPAASAAANAAFPEDVATPTALLATRGKEAAAKSGPGLDWLVKRRDELAGNLANDDQRRLFLEHSAKMFEETRAQVEAHVSQQNQVAAVESAQAREETSLLDIANNYGDATHVEEQVKDTVAALHAVQLSPEHGAAMEQQYKGKVATTLLDLRLTDAQKTGNVEGLTQQYDAVKKWLPAREREQYAKAIAGAAVDVHAEQLATRAVANAVESSGRIDEARVLDNVALIPDGPTKDEALKRARQKMTEQGQAWSTRTKEIADQAFAAFNTGGWGGIPAEVKSALNQRDPDLYDRLQNEAERKWRVRRADSAESRREQAEANKVALDDFLARPVDERASLDVQNWAIGRGVNDVGLGAVKVEQRRANDTVTKGEVDSETQFRSAATAAADRIVRGKENTKTFSAEATEAYRSLRAKLGRPPTREESDKEISNLIHSAATKPGLIYGFNEETEYQRRARERVEAVKGGNAPAPPAAASKLPKKDRALQLIRQGKTNDQIKQTLAAEGY